MITLIATQRQYHILKSFSKMWRKWSQGRRTQFSLAIISVCLPLSFVRDSTNKFTLTLFGTRTLLEQHLKPILELLSLLSFPLFVSLNCRKIMLPHSRIRFATIHEHHGHRLCSRQSDPYLVPGNDKEPRRVPYYIALLCFVQPVLQRQQQWHWPRQVPLWSPKTEHSRSIRQHTSILHPNLFRMAYEVLKHHGFDRPP